MSYFGDNLSLLFMIVILSGNRNEIRYEIGGLIGAIDGIPFSPWQTHQVRNNFRPISKMECFFWYLYTGHLLSDEVDQEG